MGIAIRLGRSGRPLGLTALAAVISVLGAGCGSGGGSQPSPSTQDAGAGAGAPKIEVRTGDLGKTLVDERGMTLYLFEKDSAGRSACSGACAAAWPPYTATGRPAVGSGVEASLLGTIKRPDGTRQVTFNDHPLYHFAGDKGPEDTNGQGIDNFGAEWYVLSPSGEKVEEEHGKESESGGKSKDGGGGGGSGY